MTFLLVTFSWPSSALRNSRSLRKDNKISRQSNLHFQNFIVVAFPTKTSILGRFSSPAPNPPLQSENFIFIVVSPSLKQCLGFFRGFCVAFPWLFRGPHLGQILHVLTLEKSSPLGSFEAILRIESKMDY